jgi:hypothetical protein
MIALLDASSGLYGDPQWQPGTAGLFAVVIGVSNYPNLDGGTAPAPNTYGFGQLATSAQTAYRVFRWLREEYDYGDAPLVRARLLLAPTNAEVRLIDGDASDPKKTTRLVDAAGSANLSACRLAIRAWRDEMGTLGAEQGAKSRALFFFSGHGIQVTDRPLLLPSDWLSDDAPTPNDSISVDNLVNGLATVRVSQQWFFCDACRNTTFKLDRLQHINGATILEEQLGGSSERSYPILYSAGRGRQAFEPAAPDEGCTFFGASLLDGLYVKSPTLVRCIPPPCRLEFDPLVRYVRTETSRRLTAKTSAAAGLGVTLGGQYGLDNPIVTHIGNDKRTVRVSKVGGPRDPVACGEDGGAASLHVRPPTPRKTQGVTSPDATEDAYERFGSVPVTSFFMRARIDGKPIVYQVVRRFATAPRVEAMFSVESIDPVQAKWPRDDGTVLTAFLPPGYRHYRVVADVAKDGVVRTLSIGPDDGVFSFIHKLYRRYRRLDPVAASKQLTGHLHAVHQSLLMKTFDPVGALEAALILQRTGRYGALYGDISENPSSRQPDDWLANLAEWFPWVGSDACILLAHRLINDPNGDRADVARIRRLIAEIPARGLPRTDEAMNYLLGLARLADVTITNVAPQVRPILETLPALRELIRANEVIDFLVETRGLFAVYSTPDGDASFSPALSVSDR